MKRAHIALSIPNASIAATRVAATIFVLVFIVPFLMWGDLYPPGLVRYWTMFGGAFAATLALALAVGASLFVGRGASTSDELAQLWHAEILLHGHLALPMDPNPEFFAIDNVIDSERWYSHFPIGAPLLLAIGRLMHAEWLASAC